ncbi:MAG: NADPH:quinone reductase [Betaproteobacteria bacterium]|nr:MAG: NADPH:quinone reductase [Betaproteobacteria bacterium]
MRAVWYECGGVAQDVLQLGEADVPEPGEGEVRVKVAYSAVNPFDVKKRVNGRDLAHCKRVIPHVDGSGEIDKVGAGVEKQRIGERVWLFGAQFGQPHGSCAEYCVVPSWKAVALPDGVALEHGACLGIPVVTALESLSAAGPLEGKSVLVAGGAGRVGAYAVQIARLHGARVIATASKSKCADVEQLGAEACIDYKASHLESRLRESGGKRGYDLVVESRFASNIALNARILACKGVIATYGVDDDPAPAIPVVQLVMMNASCRFVGIFGLSRKNLQSHFERINQLAGDGKLQHRVGLEAPLAEIVKAHQEVQEGKVAGAALIKVAQ